MNDILAAIACVLLVIGIIVFPRFIHDTFIAEVDEFCRMLEREKKDEN